MSQKTLKVPYYVPDVYIPGTTHRGETGSNRSAARSPCISFSFPATYCGINMDQPEDVLIEDKCEHFFFVKAFQRVPAQMPQTLIWALLSARPDSAGRGHKRTQWCIAHAQGVGIGFMVIRKLLRVLCPSLLHMHIAYTINWGDECQAKT